MNEIPPAPFTEQERALAGALAQQRLEGLAVSERTEDYLIRASAGEIPFSAVLCDLYSRYGHNEIFQR